MKKFLKVLGVSCVLALLGACGKEKVEKKYPSKPVEVIVAYKAGGGTDVGARILMSEAQKDFPQPFVIVNKPGADGEVGYTELLTAKPDGYTIGFINLPTFVSLPLQRHTKFSKEDAAPIMNHVYDPGVLVVRADSPWKTLEEFVKAAKERPEELTISNNGTGASNHIGAAHFAYESGIKVTHVPFGGSTDMIAALRGGHVDATVAKASEITNLVKGGELRLLASFTDKRLEKFKDIPTLKEKGYNVIFGSARAIVAPKGTPQDRLDYLNSVLKTALESESNIEKSNNSNLPLMYMSPEELGQYINNQEKYIKEIVPKLGL
ncbi:MAG: tripartite tricarboxylate transporter substrate binding protein [Fusobacterium sp. JB021]|nr:tripartite tricarboxylate transporter substrate binding protein [Fusobacterium sp. JB020]MDP0493927.1 tripartite tricarboxylate transporter substrate binding protein [Fusobacterium sp. JB021]MDP0506212.1 tripartite tricarboxylate transporter substrate binding protein [Fusobacterium sp. JB019]